MRFQNQKGQIIANILVLLFLVYFAASIFLFFLHREGLFRFEFGAEKEAEKELVFDKNRVLELIRKEKFLNEEFEKLEKEKRFVSDRVKQIEVEKGKLIADKEFISKKMAEISEKFKGLTEEEEKNLQRLANVYSKMKANRVANIFKELEDRTVADLLVRMQDKVSAKILGELGLADAKRAALISDLIQGRVNKNIFSEVS